MKLWYIIFIQGILLLKDTHSLEVTLNTNRTGRSNSLPVTLNLRDVVIGINIIKMQKGEMLQLSPLFDKKYEIFSSKIPDQSFGDDPIKQCGSKNCHEENSLDDLIAGVNSLNTDTLDDNNEKNEQYDPDTQDDDQDEADVNLVLGKTFGNWFSAPNLGTTKDESSPTHWNYVDQSLWSGTFPSCGGNRQSPIDIPETVTTVIRAPCLSWANYHSAQRYLTFENNGHSIYASSTWAQGGLPMLSGGVLTGAYTLAAVHWHWGRDNSDGSEHSFQSRKFPLEMHLVHFNTQYPTLVAALASNDPQALVVVGVMFKASIFSNPGMTLLTQAMRRATSLGTQNTVLPLGHLGLNFKDGYYTYLGSLTSPPCNQVVRWVILKKVLHIRSNQLKVFRSILVNGKPLVDNYRFVQPLNGRQVQSYDQCL